MYSLHKIWLVTQREFLTRVKNKAFILTTILAPLGLLLFFIVLGFILSRGSDKVKKIMIVDSTGLMRSKMDVESKNIILEFSDRTVEQLKSQYPKPDENKEKPFFGILEIAPMIDSIASAYNVHFISDDQLGLEENYNIRKSIENRIREIKLSKLKIKEEQIKSLDTEITLTPSTIYKDKKISSDTALVSSGLGMVVGYAMFFIILLYGTQVMRSVMEEKINRIIEVLISSIKPFELMMGKVLGVGLVGLTQVAIWMVLLPIVSMIGQGFLGIDANSIQETANLPHQAELGSGAAMKIGLILNELKSMNWPLILPLTLFYFLVGYFAYASLFAAVGSAVGEDVNEAQSLTFPLMMPLLIGFYISISAINAPDSTMVVWASMIPLLSSIVMPVRLPFDPPIWQILVSVVSLLLTTFFLIWLAARIYRVGILMYGKKASFKELSKWIFYKG